MNKDKFRMPRLSEEDQQKFHEWYGGIAKTYGLSPDPYDMRHFYDWESLWMKNKKAKANLEGHWPSKFKFLGHPNLLNLQGGNLVDTSTGVPATGDDWLLNEWMNAFVNSNAQGRK